MKKHKIVMVSPPIVTESERKIFPLRIGATYYFGSGCLAHECVLWKIRPSSEKDVPFLTLAAQRTEKGQPVKIYRYADEIGRTPEEAVKRPMWRPRNMYDLWKNLRNGN